MNRKGLFLLVLALCLTSASGFAADLPTNIYTYTLQRTIPSVRRTFTSPSPLRSIRQYRIINLFFHQMRRSASP